MSRPGSPSPAPAATSSSSRRRRTKGGEKLVLTGQLGDVMKESAQIALSAVRAHATDFGLDEDTFEDRSFHIHVPAGAIPKDGPSAGITMATAFASLLSGRPVKHTVGMTGEVTLQGRVLPIGGLKQKVLAAHAAGLTDVIIPERNRADLDDVPQKVRDEIDVPPGDVARRGAGGRARAEGRLAMSRCRTCAPVPEEVRRAAGLLERRWTRLDPLGVLRGGLAVQRVPAGGRRDPADDARQRLVELENAGVLERAGRRRAAAARRVPADRARGGGCTRSSTHSSSSRPPLTPSGSRPARAARAGRGRAVRDR